MASFLKKMALVTTRLRYTLDVLVRIIVLRQEWYFDPRQGFMFLNIFDACVVAVNAFELLIMPLPLGLTLPVIAAMSRPQDS